VFPGAPVQESFIGRFEGFLRFKDQSEEAKQKREVCFDADFGEVKIESETLVGQSSFTTLKAGECKSLDFNMDEFYSLMATASSKKGIFIGQKDAKGIKKAFDSELYSIRKDLRSGIWAELFEGSENDFNVHRNGLLPFTKLNDLKRSSLLIFKNVNVGVQGFFDYDGGVLSFITRRDEYSLDNWASNLQTPSSSLMKFKNNYLLKLSGYIRLFGGQEVK
jgi:hypothetical protein